MLDSVPGIGAIWAGAGDLSVSLGYRGEQTPEVEAGLQEILDICRAAGVPCGTQAGSWRDSEHRVEQGYQIVLTRPELPSISSSADASWQGRAGRHEVQEQP